MSSKHDPTVEKFSENTSGEPLREWILGTSGCTEHHVNTHSLDPVSEMAIVNAITIPDQILRCTVVSECFNNLH
jgi:hypothetical protein